MPGCTEGSVESIKLVCFDLGGVIVRIHRCWAEACRAAGLEVRGDVLRPENRLIRQRISTDNALGRLTEDEWLLRLFDALDGIYSIEEILRIHDGWLIGEYPGVAAVMEKLNRAGVELACLSNTNARHWRRLTGGTGDPSSRREPEFPTVLKLKHRYASHLIGSVKPNAEIYRCFEESVGLRGGEILFFDDTRENVEAARLLGWQAELIDPDDETSPQLGQSLRLHGLTEGDGVA